MKKKLCFALTTLLAAVIVTITTAPGLRAEAVFRIQELSKLAECIHDGYCSFSKTGAAVFASIAAPISTTIGSFTTRVNTPIVWATRLTASDTIRGTFLRGNVVEAYEGLYAGAATISVFGAGTLNTSGNSYFGDMVVFGDFVKGRLANFTTGLYTPSVTATTVLVGSGGSTSETGALSFLSGWLRNSVATLGSVFAMNAAVKNNVRAKNIYAGSGYLYTLHATQEVDAPTINADDVFATDDVSAADGWFTQTLGVLRNIKALNGYFAQEVHADIFEGGEAFVYSVHATGTVDAGTVEADTLTATSIAGTNSATKTTILNFGQKGSLNDGSGTITMSALALPKVKHVPVAADCLVANQVFMTSVADPPDIYLCPGAASSPVNLTP